VEPGAVELGVVTRDVFGLEDPSVASDIEEALTNLSPAADESFVLAAEAQLSLDLPTIPLFETPVALVDDTDIRAVGDSPTWAGIFWDAEDWVIQVRPAVVPTSLPPTS